MAKEKLQEELQETEDITSKYTYVLCSKNEKRGMVYDGKNNLLPDQEYPKQRNLLLRSSIVWPADAQDPFKPKGEIRKRGKYLIRYYDGCATLFMDDQPKDKEVIEQLVRSTRELYFQNGYLHIYGYDAMLKTYIDWASWNEGSPYKVPTIDSIFKLLDSEQERMVAAASIDEVEEALRLAKLSADSEMVIHAKFLNVPLMDFKTGNKLSMKSIRAEYRQAAMHDPKFFIKTYNDKTLHVRYWVEKAMDEGEISTTIVPNSAVWAKKGAIICNISGLQSREAILNKLIEFVKTEDEGKEFEQQLKVLYN